MKCWRSSKLIEESALESSASLYPLAESFSMKKPFFLTNVSRLLLLLLFLFVLFSFLFFLCIADDLTSKETVEDWLRMALRPACAKIVHSLSSFYDIWCPGFLFHQIVSLCKYLLYRGAKYARSYSLQPETRSWRSSSYPFRADTHRETYQTSIDRWTLDILLSTPLLSVKVFTFDWFVESSTEATDHVLCKLRKKDNWHWSYNIYFFFFFLRPFRKKKAPCSRHKMLFNSV